MKRVGVRDLRQRASEVLREVDRGRTVAVTTRGRQVAILVPARIADRRQRLAASGRLTLAEGDPLDLGAPLTPVAGVPIPSRRLTRARAKER